jgi:PAS domain S-box-containing protein
MKAQQRILLVEDDASMRSSLTMILSRKGYHIETASSGTEASEMVKKSNYHLGILDIKLPDMDGIELLGVLKEINPDMVVIMVTGYASIETAVRALNAGASAYITKPVNLDEVLAIIREALEKQRLAEEKFRAETALVTSEERYRRIFETTPVSIWEEDFSAIKKKINELKKQGVENLRLYLDENPEIIQELIEEIEVIDVNKATLEMFGAASKDELIGSLDKIALQGTEEIIKDEVIAIFEGETNFVGETVNRTLQGKLLDVMINISIPQREADFSNVLVSMVDISERKKAEDAIRARSREVRLLYEAGMRLGGSLELGTVYENVYELVEDVMACDGLYISTYNQKDQTIRCEAVWGDKNPLDTSHFPLLDLEPEGKGTQSVVIRTGKPLYIPDYDKRLKDTSQVFYVENESGQIKEERIPSEEDFIRSAVIVPLKLENEVIGIIQVQSYELDAYSEEKIDFLNALAPQVAVAMANARLYEQSQDEISKRIEADKRSQSQLERISALHSIDTAISSSFDLRVTMDILLTQVVLHLAVDAATVFLLNPNTQMLEFVVSKGFRTRQFNIENIMLGHGRAGISVLDQEIVHIENIQESDTDLLRSPQLRREGFISYICVPLMAKGQVVGVMEIFHRNEFKPEPDWLDFLTTLAGQAAIAIDNTTLFTSLQRANLELELAYDNTLEGWSRALELRDMETKGHSQRVTEYTIKLAQMMGMNKDEIVQVRRGALLHDIGKMGVPDHILLKPGPLTDEEWDVMKQHPENAYKLLSPIPFLKSALDIPYYHHERWDGSGYPQGLQGEQIPLSARIFSVVDVWDALSSDRPYRKAWSREKTVKYLQEEAGTLFDPNVIDVFLELLDQLP